MVAISLPLQIALPGKWAPKYTILGCFKNSRIILVPFQIVVSPVDGSKHHLHSSRLDVVCLLEVVHEILIILALKSKIRDSKMDEFLF